MSKSMGDTAKLWLKRMLKREPAGLEMTAGTFLTDAELPTTTFCLMLIVCLSSTTFSA